MDGRIGAEWLAAPTDGPAVAGVGSLGVTVEIRAGSSESANVTSAIVYLNHAGWREDRNALVPAVRSGRVIGSRRATGRDCLAAAGSKTTQR
jgi:hypothetical protein